MPRRGRKPRVPAGRHGNSFAVAPRRHLAAARAGRRIVPVCPLFAAYVGKHDDVTDIVDQPDVHIMRYLREHTG